MWVLVWDGKHEIIDCSLLCCHCFQDPVTGEDISFYPFIRRFFKMSGSFGIMLFMVRSIIVRWCRNFFVVAVVTVEPSFQRCPYQSARKRGFWVNIRLDKEKSKTFSARNAKK